MFAAGKFCHWTIVQVKVFRINKSQLTFPLRNPPIINKPTKKFIDSWYAVIGGGSGRGREGGR